MLSAFVLATFLRALLPNLPRGVFPQPGASRIVGPHTIMPAGTTTPGHTKTIRLTFDLDMTAGMEARLAKKKVAAWYSPGLVAYLADQHVPYTAFVTGMFAQTYPDLVRQMARTPGVTIGNHTYDHDAFTAKCYRLAVAKTDTAKKDEIEKTEHILQSLGAPRPVWFRYPGLCHDAHDDALVAAAGLHIAPDDLVSGDAFAKDAGRVTRAVLAGAHDGATVVMHLGGPNAPATEEAVRRLVPLLRARGYAFAAL